MTTWKEKRRVKNCYNLTSDIYNRRYLKEQEKKFKQALLHLNLKPDSAVLDVGCGSGLFFTYVSSKVGFVVGIDISIELLNKAKKEVNAPNIHLIQADADHLPFQAKRFNIVFAFTVLQNMPSPLKTLKEIRVATKNDGQIIVTGLKKVFSMETFLELLRKSGFNIISLENGSKLKGYIAIMQK
ncbi:MAG: class I SAM-dependent methyltransferase [Candidatus Bathyarchaeota archaeon]|nr:class I SAM-dependent methyltransferase [Candidatus Bathyarchaeota archaeon]